MSDYVDMGDGPFYWPMCVIPGCKNRQCLALQSVYCWPHSHELAARVSVVDADDAFEALTSTSDSKREPT
jgi:hypothetical protein